MGQVGAPVHLVSTAEDVARLDLPDDAPVAYVTQTTLSVDDTRGIIAALQARFSDIVGPGRLGHLLCDPEPPDGGARTVQGGGRDPGGRRRNSSNSNRLREIGVEEGVPSYLIADGSELESGMAARSRDRRPDRRRLGARGTGATTSSRRCAGMARSRSSRWTASRTYRVPAARRTQDAVGASPPCHRSDRGAFVGIPLLQAARIGAYVVRQHLAGRKRYPLVLMLEPLFRCNLACAGCGKIDYPDEILNQRLSYDECMDAIDECGAPVVSIAGGEPLLHREMPQDRQGLHRAQEVRDPVHQRAAAGQEDRPVQAASRLHLVHPSRRRQGDARQVGLPATASTTRPSRRSSWPSRRASASASTARCSTTPIPARRRLLRRDDGDRAGRHHRLARLCL